MYATDTATDYADLLVRLQQFLTADLSAPERWTALRWYGRRATVASSNVTNHEPWRAFDASVGADAYWRTAQTQALPSHLAVRLVAALDLRQYAITAPTVNAATEAPTAWDLQYSDDGSAWTTLQSWSGQTWSAGQRRVYDVTATSAGAHAWWRLRPTANGGSTDYTGIGRWELLEAISGLITLDHGVDALLLAQGPGATPGVDEPHIGVQLYSNPTSDIFNWRVLAFDGFNPAASFVGQPGSSPALGLPLRNDTITYHFVGNGRRVIVLATFSGVWEMAYLGLHLRRRTPGQYPYPLVAGAPLTSDALTRFSDLTHSSFWKGDRANLRMKSLTNTWAQPECWPWNNTGVTRRDGGGGYPLCPIVLNDSAGIYGELEGLYHVSGFANAAGNTATLAGEDYLVVPDVYRDGLTDFVALKTE